MFPVLLSQAPVKRASISVNASGQTAIVAAVSGKKIRVLSAMLTAVTNVVYRFQSASSDLTGPFTLAILDTSDIPPMPAGAFETNVGEALNLTASTTAASVVGGYLTYQEIGG